MACDIFNDTHIITHTHHRTLVTSILSCLLFWWLHSQHQSVPPPRHASVNVFWHTHKYCYKCFSQKICNNFTIGLRKLYFSQSWQLENCSIFWYMIYLNDVSLRFYFLRWWFHWLFISPNNPSRNCDGQSPVTFTLKVNETSTGTLDLFSTGLFLSDLILICSGQKTVLDEKVGSGETGRLALLHT